MTIRRVEPGDLGFLAEMLAQAVFWEGGDPDTEAALSDPAVAAYLEGWGRNGDDGLIALEGRERVGAAWYRSFPSSARGYGFVASNVPEITVAVKPENRARGLGKGLLSLLIAMASEASYPALSLSVARGNHRAIRLYRSLGFTVVGDDGHSLVMTRPV